MAHKLVQPWESLAATWGIGEATDVPHGCCSGALHPAGLQAELTEARPTVLVEMHPTSAVRVAGSHLPGPAASEQCVLGTCLMGLGWVQCVGVTILPCGKPRNSP